ncbi:MAG: transcription termination factor Rho [Solirubrobacteraceae bacterium]|jgi:transcription termination factor Rho|nr:transcription termination factor Rho [Solirubrobacteraceae bacterium]
MSVLTRTSLEGSPLADLHELASELEIDGFRRLRKADLVDRILEVHGGAAEEPAPAEADAEADASQEAEEVTPEPEEKPKRARSRPRRTRDADVEPAAEEPKPQPRAARPAARDEDAPEQATAEGVVELLANGSGFVRVNPPDASDDDIYISAAQIRRCELVAGDRVAGPVRKPRRSERYPSLVRVDTINGKSADEVSEGTHFDDLPCGFATERLALGDGDPTLQAIEWLTPIGRGSRVTITGATRAGKSETLRRLAGALAATDGLELTVVLAGARPEEAASWKSDGLVEPASVAGLAASADTQGQAIERCIDTAKRIAARGGHAVVLIDSLDGVPAAAARRALAAARAITDGGSLTVIAASTLPVGGETTVVALDVALASTNRFPALDLVASGTLRPELLVGAAGAEAIAEARLKALG